MTRVYPDSIVEKYWKMAQRKSDMTRTDILALKDNEVLTVCVRLLDFIDFLVERIECMAVNIYESEHEGIP